MRRSATKVINDLEHRIARLEKQSAPKGKGQIAIMERLQEWGIGEHYFNDVVSGLRVNYGSLQSAAKALHNKGLVKVDNPNVPLMIQLTEKGEQMRIARLENKSAGAGMDILKADPSLAKALGSCKIEKEIPFESVVYYSEDPDDTGSDGGYVRVCSFKTKYYTGGGVYGAVDGIKTNYVVVTEAGSHRASYHVEGFFHNIGEATNFAKMLVAELNKPTYDY